MRAAVYYCHCPPSQGRDSDAGKWMAQGAINEAEAKEGDGGERKERGDACRGAPGMGIVLGGGGGGRDNRGVSGVPERGGR